MPIDLRALLRRYWWVLALFVVPTALAGFFMHKARSKPPAPLYEIVTHDVICRPIVYRITPGEPVVATIGCDNGFRMQTTDGSLIRVFMSRAKVYKGDDRMYCSITKKSEIVKCH